MKGVVEGVSASAKLSNGAILAECDGKLKSSSPSSVLVFTEPSASPVEGIVCLNNHKETILTKADNC